MLTGLHHVLHYHNFLRNIQSSLPIGVASKMAILCFVGIQLWAAGISSSLLAALLSHQCVNMHKSLSTLAYIQLCSTSVGYTWHCIQHTERDKKVRKRQSVLLSCPILCDVFNCKKLITRIGYGSSSHSTKSNSSTFSLDTFPIDIST